MSIGSYIGRRTYIDSNDEMTAPLPMAFMLYFLLFFSLRSSLYVCKILIPKSGIYTVYSL